MGFVTPFKTFADGYQSTNPLILANDDGTTKAGKTPVQWNFTTMPSKEWKNGGNGQRTFGSTHRAQANGIT